LGNVQYTYGGSIKSLEQTDKDINVTFTSGLKDTFDLVVGGGGSTSTIGRWFWTSKFSRIAIIS
jgi:hypothetical protein